jgi:catechol 2,3-dioxygenase-like lactoylglutathione lyase family enzyme
MQEISLITLIVRDYDEAIAFYVEKLGFELLEDTRLPDKRVRPRASRGPAILLARAETPEQTAAIGNQTGGRVFLFLETDDFKRDYAAFSERGVKCARSPSRESYGWVAVFEDLYGNKFDLIQYIR